VRKNSTGPRTLRAACGTSGSKRGCEYEQKLFGKLVKSMTQMDALTIKELRASVGLSQPKFAALLHVDVGTLRNWEQGRREPIGPAKALPTAIQRDPKNVLKALAL
jgi:DNA-binding transcriptional regulator YiaG